MLKVEIDLQENTGDGKEEGNTPGGMSAKESHKYAAPLSAPSKTNTTRA